MSPIPKFYLYKLPVDNGGAPCVQGGLLSLAICKPSIRRTAKRGDWIFGFAASSLHRDNSLVYVAEVAEVVPNGDYYGQDRFRDRVDCIYEKVGNGFTFRRGARHHSPASMDRDLGDRRRGANVLLSTDFRYFGSLGDATYKGIAAYEPIRRSVERLTQGHRVNHEPALREALTRLKREVWMSWPARKVGKPINELSVPCHSANRGACRDC